MLTIPIILIGGSHRKFNIPEPSSFIISLAILKIFITIRVSNHSLVYEYKFIYKGVYFNWVNLMFQFVM